jgi:hypothetical protein
MFREISNPEATKPEQVIKRWIEPEQPQAPDRECRRYGRSRKEAIYDRGRYHPEHCDASHCPARMTIHPIAAEFALVRGLKSPRALRREQPGCAGADPESKPDRSLLPSSLRAIRRVVVATRESPFQSPVFQGGHILGP